MNTFNLSLATIVAASIFATAAFAQDGVSVAGQGATTSYAAVLAAQASAQPTVLPNAEGYLIQHNALGNR